MNGQLPDVATGEKERAHHITVGGEGNTFSACDVREYGGIGAAVEQGILEGGHEQRFNKRVTGLAATPVTQGDVFIAHARRPVAHDARTLHPTQLRRQRHLDAIGVCHAVSTDTAHSP